MAQGRAAARGAVLSGLRGAHCCGALDRAQDRVLWPQAIDGAIGGAGPRGHRHCPRLRGLGLRVGELRAAMLVVRGRWGMGEGYS